MIKNVFHTCSFDGGRRWGLVGIYILVQGLYFFSIEILHSNKVIPVCSLNGSFLALVVAFLILIYSLHKLLHRHILAVNSLAA